MDPKQQELVAKLQSSTNILVTVSANPSVDQLAACIGITLLLNKLKKHGTAVFSGAVPSTIEFLKPDETIEKNTDSLRDFIISLDKAKADKLRYKVEDNVVKIFITPYKTSITDADLDFSQGDFNVDIVLCLGVNDQADLDQAITTHGRILHDAAVVSVNTHEGGELGSINWTNTNASSLSELVALLCDQLGKELIDGQIATALLTGIVAETGRFSNEKTSPLTMRLAAELMAAGANQQLVATELEITPEPPVPTEASTEVANPTDSDEKLAEAETQTDGTLEINHPAEAQKSDESSNQADAPSDQTDPESNRDEIAEADQVPDYEAHESEPPASADEAATGASQAPEAAEPAADDLDASEVNAENESQKSDEPAVDAETPISRIMLQPPSLGGTLTANSTPEQATAMPDLLTSQSGHDEPLLSRAANTDETTAEATKPESITEPTAEPEPQLDLPTPQEAMPEPVAEAMPAPEEPTIVSSPVSDSPEFDIHDQPDAPADQAPVLPVASDLISPDATSPAGDANPGQIQIDPNGNIVLPPAPILPASDPLSPPPLPAVDATAPATPDPLVADTSTGSTDDGTANIDAARDAVMSAINAAPLSGPPQPKESINAGGYLNVQDLEATTTNAPPIAPPLPDLTEAAAATPQAADQLPQLPVQPAPADPTPPAASAHDAPPPVPPPLPLADLSKFTPTNQQ